MISVIIPIYNVAGYLDECVQSVVSQKYTDWECILVDDGSTDGSGDICDKWTKKNERIRVIHQTNGGVSRARNTGIVNAKGDYLYFIDADDWCLENVFSCEFDSDMVIGGYVVGKTVVRSVVSQSNNYPLDFLKENICTRLGAFFIRRSVVMNHQIFFENNRKYAEDLSFILRCLVFSQSVAIQNKIFMEYRQTPDSAMHQYNFNRFDTYFSRLWLLNTLLFDKNEEMLSYLHHFSCIEAVVKATRDLFSVGYPTSDVRMFYDSHPCIYVTLIRAMKDESLVKEYRDVAKLLLCLPWLYRFKIRVMFCWYDIHALLGRMKRKFFRKC